MKNKIALGLAALVALTNVKVSAGDREWATVGKVLTGVVAVQVIDRIVNPPTQVVYVQQPATVVVAPPQPQAVYVQQPQVVYVQQPVVYYPAPVVVRYGYGHRWHHCR